MPKRYLTANEFGNTLHQGKPVEVFLGGDSKAVLPTIHWLEIYLQEERIVCAYWKTEDPCDPEYRDLSTLVGDEDAIHYSFETVDQCLEALELRFPGSTSRIVNFGLSGDEYVDYLKGVA